LSHSQVGSNLEIKFSYFRLKQNSLPLTISLDEVWLQAFRDWQAWKNARLENYDPNHAPVIQDSQALQQQLLPRTYQNLTTAIDGEQTLRDLAVKSNKDLVTMTRSLLPYVQQGLVSLLEVVDLQLTDRNLASTEAKYSDQELKSVTTSQKISSPSVEGDTPLLKPAHYTESPQILPPKNSVESELETPLIAYIDDYKVDGLAMHQILDQIGYRLIHIQDPMQALPLLLEHKPKLIFLDLVMPIVNGYEACAQIRRVSRFKDTPIIILTSNDGIIDRVRAKIVGSTDFLSKPIEPKKVQMVLKKHLS
jgi:chemotaxis family two-component system response regulator PixG